MTNSSELRADIAAFDAAVVAIVRWAQDAPHRYHCATVAGARGYPGPCTCGRDEALRPFKADRG